jgi:P-type Cu+ transporter
MLLERSRGMHVRELWHILDRVILSVTAAISVLIVGVVYMNLVSANDPGRKYLMERIGGVSRAEWANFIIATPVCFFAANGFHRRMFKELRALWRLGSPVPILRRFYRFGSLNMLISFGTTIAYFASIAELGIAASRSPQSDMAMSSSSLTYFDSVVFLTMFLLIGRLIESHTKAKTRDAVATLSKFRPTEAVPISDAIDASGQVIKSSPHRIETDLLEVGDIVECLMARHRLVTVSWSKGNQTLMSQVLPENPGLCTSRLVAKSIREVLIQTVQSRLGSPKFLAPQC